MNIDHIVESKIEENVNMAIPYYLMAAYAYYKEDDSIISDRLFDSMALLILKEYDHITHPHKKYITRGDLEAGTYLGQYPTIVKDTLKLIRQEMK